MFSNRRIPAVAALAAAVPLALAGCSGGTETPAEPSGPVTLTWWHNGTTDPIKSIWAQVVADYQKAHPEVTIKGQPLQNEEFTTKVPLALQSNEPPDVYQSWGGGELASQATSGKVADLTDAAKEWLSSVGKLAESWQVDGKQYGIPWEQHFVGFWYRKDLFAQAGVTAPPSTLDELNAAVAKLKQAGITPIAVGGKDRWPDAFYWNYFALRACSADTLKQSVKAVKLEDPCWTKAGQDLQAFLATQPFQPGFTGTPAQQGAGSSAGLVANGKAAMELQGDWEPGTMSSLTEDKDLDSKVGWFPFPSVPGGAGDPAAVLGGGDGFSCTTRAAKACVEFLRYLGSEPVQNELAAKGAGLPMTASAAKSLKTESLKTVFDYGQKAPYLQMYFDKAFPTAVGAALNDAVANFFAGQGTPEGIVDAVNKAAAGDK
ncbi:ABC transporter substrate-binding protein [Amycolatopsis pittospori]|uniref:ABC transporter substrate-binding protein n=1 Tax=Amycolatopsis pittospori TaxID=2749434 RepID=UPI0015EFE173|nr:extracellular solute-binding protein [Amycolatopsis pittospori]